MSTVPGDAWRDAGLEDQDPTSLLEEVQEIEEPDGTAPPTGRQEEYRPGSARPDLDGGASEADVVEQSQAVRGLDERDDVSGGDDDDGTDDAAGA